MGDKWGKKTSDFFLSDRGNTTAAVWLLLSILPLKPKLRWESWQISTVKLDGRFDIQYERVGDTEQQQHSHISKLCFSFPRWRGKIASWQNHQAGNQKQPKPNDGIGGIILFWLGLRKRAQHEIGKYSNRINKIPSEDRKIISLLHNTVHYFLRRSYISTWTLFFKRESY